MPKAECSAILAILGTEVRDGTQQNDRQEVRKQRREDAQQPEGEQGREVRCWKRAQSKAGQEAVMDEARLVLDYIGVLVWPLVAISVAFLAVTRFREEIAHAILRIQTIKAPLGTEILLEEQREAAREPPPAPEPAPAEEAEAGADDSVDEEFEQLRADLQNAQTDLFYERAYRVIYGTQIALLQDLNQRTGGMTLAQVMADHYQRHLALGQALNVHYQIDFTTYMQFLVSWGLVENRLGTYTITAWGRGLLTYLTAQGIPMVKAL